MAGDDADDSQACCVGEAVSEAGEPVIIMRWRLTDEERARVFGGEDIFLYVFAPRLPALQQHVGSRFHEFER